MRLSSQRMNLKRITFTSGILLALGVTLLSLFKFYFKGRQIQFYNRLKNKKRLEYKVKNIRINKYTVTGDIISKKAIFTLKLTFLNDKILNFQINDSTKPRYIIQDVVLLKDQEIKSEKLHTEEKNKTFHITYSKFTITINCNNLLINIFNENNLILSVNSKNLLIIEEKEPQVAISADFYFPNATKAYGLPQHAENLILKATKTKPYRLYNTDRFGYSAKNNYESLYGAVPLIYGFGSNQTTGLLWLNSSETFTDIEYETGGLFSTFFSESGALEFCVLSGPTFAECVQQNSQLTGNKMRFCCLVFVFQ